MDFLFIGNRLDCESGYYLLVEEVKSKLYIVNIYI